MQHMLDSLGTFTRDGNDIQIVMFARPVGKPRMTQRDKWAKRPVVLAYRAWCDRLRSIVGNKLPPVEQIAELSWRAEFVPPKSWPAKRRRECLGQRHRATPDRDNIDKAVLDCLFKRDEAITAGRLEKWWSSRDALTITIELEAAEAGKEG